MTSNRIEEGALDRRPLTSMISMAFACLALAVERISRATAMRRSSGCASVARCHAGSRTRARNAW
jgi:hypothetical protein